jgi:hypothetical protein
MALYMMENLWFCAQKVHESSLKFTSKVQMLSFWNQEVPLVGVGSYFPKP